MSESSKRLSLSHSKCEREWHNGHQSRADDGRLGHGDTATRHLKGDSSNVLDSKHRAMQWISQGRGRKKVVKLVEDVHTNKFFELIGSVVGDWGKAKPPLTRVPASLQVREQP